MSLSSPTCRLVTLGCKVNQYESQFVKEALELNGYREAADGERADLCLVNTCTVTMEGDAKSRQAIRRLHQQQPHARIVVMGCYATRAPDEVGRLPGVARVIQDKQRLPEELKDYGVELWPLGIERFDGHRRAFVKVQDGCVLNCTYCIIPQVRPVLRSRLPEEIRAEVEALVAGGVREIVLTGIHLGHYGLDLSKGRPKHAWRRLWHLLDLLADMPGEFRVRLSSLEAAEARDDLVAALIRNPRVAPHLHLCLQSGSDRILALMKRRYRTRGFIERCVRLRRALDQPAFTTDIIVGFPGETEADFQETLNVVREVGFAKLHVFSYSPRAGTAAAVLRDAPAPAVIADRRQRLLDLERETAHAYQRSLLGSRLDVLIEGLDPQRPGCAWGTSCRYVPVSIPGYAPALLGRLAPVRATATVANVVIGEPLPEPVSSARLPEPRRGRLSLPCV
jgi:threonylcarbamoyladenosine tRNA methylthiotransferase MtaB